MKEFFVNKYVVETKHGHPGSTTYTIYSTRDDMAVMVRALSAALSAPDAAQAEAWHSSQVLWQDYATTAGGKTCRVSLAFQLAEDLAPFHVRPTFISRLMGWLRLACLMVFLAFAGIGMSAVASGYVRVSPVIQGILFGIPLIGIAIAILWIRDRMAVARIRRK